eukprot:COSAG01_NODE_10_length_42970_cov_93.010007_41_plen_80_part_00
MLRERPARSAATAQVNLECPRCVHVAGEIDNIRDSVEHHSAVAKLRTEIEGLPVHCDACATLHVYSAATVGGTEIGTET